MIGNDVIDLKLANTESNWQRPRFLQKIFTKSEQDFIQRANRKELALWLLWSRKESVYKIVARRNRKRFFAPKKFRNQNLTDVLNVSNVENLGQITFEEFRFSTKSVVTDNYIHTVAQWGDSPDSIATNCFYLAKNDYATQYQTTRQQLLAAYAERTQLSIQELSIRKDEWSIPHLYYKNKQMDIPISISHHGYYGGYAWHFETRSMSI